MGNSLGASGAITTGTWTTVDVTSYITADGTYSFAFSTTSSTNISFSSREGANAPELVIETSTGPTNTPTATVTAGPSPTPTNTSVATPTASTTPTPTATSTGTVAPPASPTPQPFQSASFSYDGDGKRVKSVINGTTTTFFIGNYYERVGITTASITKYYYAGSQRIAMRTNGELQFLIGDHLGSTSLTTDAAGNKVSELHYKAWGEVRYASGPAPTKYRYTGQFSYESEFGLYFYNARWYDSSLGRFAQADSIIPQTQGVQAWDRFAYTNNNPVRYTDPSGHMMSVFDGGGKYKPKPSYTFQPNLKPAGNQIQLNIMAGITLDAEGLDGNPQTVGFLYYSFSVVTDNKGQLQFYITSLDQEFIEGSESPTHMGGYQTVPPVGVEKDNQDSAYGLGLSLAWGMIDGNKFSREGTPVYEGKAEDAFIGVDVVSVDAYRGLDENGNPSTDLVGVDVGVGIGVPVSMGTVTINSVPINRKPIQIPSMFIPMCQSFGMCGSSTIPGSSPLYR